MVNNLALLAALASVAVALPTYPSAPAAAPVATYPTVSKAASHPTSSPTVPKYPTSKPSKGNASISASLKGVDANIVMGLEAAAGGVFAMSVSVDAKNALSVFINGSGKGLFDPSISAELLSFCSKSDKTILSVQAQMAIDFIMLGDVSVNAAGGLLPFLNGLISVGLDGKCACEKLSGADLANLSIFMGLYGADIDATVLGALKLAVIGGVAETLSSPAKAALTAYISGPDSVNLSADLKTSLTAWMTVGASVNVGTGTGAIVTIGTTKAPAGLVCDAPTKAALTVFINGPSFALLDVDVKAGLKAAALGGSASVLSGTVKASLGAYLASVECKLEPKIKATLNLFVANIVGDGILSVSVDAVPEYVSAAITMAANIDVTGALTPSVQADLLAFTSGPSALTIDINALTACKKAAKGTVALNLAPEEALSLGLLVAGPSTLLTAEMKGTLALFLSMGVTGSTTAAVGVGKGAGAGLSLATGPLLSLQATVGSLIPTVTADVAGVLGLVLSGDNVSSCSKASRAELLSFILSGNVNSLDVNVKMSLLSFLLGMDVSAAVKL